MARGKVPVLLPLAAAAALLGGACATPAPPEAVETPYGVVRAATEEKAAEVAALLAELSPRVNDLLPATRERAVDVWVQGILRDARNAARARGVKGFTILAGDFRPKRIHLVEVGELRWYLSHELVHALLEEEWAPLPGLLEEGLGDVVAAHLAPEAARRIRAHRLFTASGFTGGVGFELVHTVQRPEGGRTIVETPLHLEVLEDDPGVGVRELLMLSRKELRARWSELPESFYGLAYLVVSRIVEREGFVGLFRLCEEARADGLELVPVDRLLAAAEIDLERFDSDFLAEQFGPLETLEVLEMQPEIFGDTIASFLRDESAGMTDREVLFGLSPSLVTADGTLLRLRNVPAVRDRILTAALPADAGR